MIPEIGGPRHPAARPAAHARPPEPVTAPVRDLRRRTLVLTDASATTLPEIHVAGGTATVVTFQSDIADGGVLLGSVARLFYPLAQTTRMIVLSPRADLTGSVPLNVQLKDGTILTFQCRSSAVDVDAQVDVVLNFQRRAAADSATALKASLSALRDQLDECRSTAGDAGTQKLASLLLSQNLEAPQPFDRRPIRALERQNALLVQARWVYRLMGLTYLVLTVENRDAERPWVLDRIDVSTAGTREKADIKVAAWAAEIPSLAPDQTERVVISFPTPSSATTQRIVVTLFERDGSRSVALPAMEL